MALAAFLLFAVPILIGCLIGGGLVILMRIEHDKKKNINPYG